MQPPASKLSSDRRILPQLVAQSLTVERKKETIRVRIQRPRSQLHVTQFRRRTSKRCRRPRAKAVALLRPEPTLYVPCVISREGINETLSRLGDFRCGEDCNRRTFDLRPLWSWRELRFQKHVALKCHIYIYIWLHPLISNYLNVFLEIIQNYTI